MLSSKSYYYFLPRFKPLTFALSETTPGDARRSFWTGWWIGNRWKTICNGKRLLLIQIRTVFLYIISYTYYLYII